MNKKVVVISTSLRNKSNSEILAESFAKGAEDAGNNVEFISLKNKKISFCKGCLACQKTGECVIKDDVIDIEKSVLNADVVVFATPVYYYEMSGQMKTLLDRMNSLYPKDYKFREVYMLSVAAEDEEYVPERAVSGLCGWTECFGKAELKGAVFCGGVNSPADIEDNPKLNEAYTLGKNL